MTELSAAELLSKWNDLIKVFAKHQSTRKMSDFLEFHGYRRLGAGMYGSAWMSPAKNVIKVNFSMQGARDGWWLWATQSLENPGNPWMPKVYSLLRDGDWYVAHVEHLTDVMEEETVLPWRDEGVPIPSDAEFSRMIDDLIDLRMVYGNIYGKANTKQDFLKDMRNQFDLHRGNWMWRDGNQLVLNDPINSLAETISDTAMMLDVAQAA